MKKIITIVALMTTLFLSGCTPVEEGNYKEGTYYGSAQDTFGGQNNTATAVIYVNEAGVIKSVFLDTTYTKDEKITTKKTLKEDYGMKSTSEAAGNIPGGAEWYEQIQSLEKKIVEEQGLAWLSWADAEKTKTDAVSGVTIKINALIDAVTDALNQAKK